MFPSLKYQHVFSQKGKEFIELCREIVSSGKLQAEPVKRLRSWLQSNGEVAFPAVTFVRVLFNRISQDNKITGKESKELMSALEHYVAEAERLSEDNGRSSVGKTRTQSAPQNQPTRGFTTIFLTGLLISLIILTLFLVPSISENGSMEAHFLIAPVSILLGLACLCFAITNGRRHRLVNDIPTSKVLGVFIGLVELKGTCESELPLRSYLAERLCAQYEYKIEEHWSYTETYTDKDGKTKTRRHSGWKTVDSHIEMRNFYLRDETGIILIRPTGAEIEGMRIFSQTCGTFHPLYYGKGPSMPVANSDHRRRFTETALPLHAELYIVGRSREREDVVAPEIARDPEAEMFLISTRDEAQVARSFRWGFWGQGIFGVLLSVGGLVGGDLAAERDPVYWAYWTAGLVYLGLWATSWIVMVFNSIVRLKNRVRKAWAQIDIQLKRRAALIPSLVKVIEGFRAHETDTQKTVAKLRSQQGNRGLSSAACQNSVIALAESYPQLKSHKLFAKLQKQLVETEDRIALARAYYNDIATFYNTRVEVLPDLLIAKLGGMKQESLMSSNGFEAKPIMVKLSEEDDGPVEEVPVHRGENEDNDAKEDDF